jgi:serine/threonine protein kinase
MRLFDAIDTPKQLYLILESCEGRILHSVMKSSTLSESQVSKIFYQIMRGMEFYHSRSIAHRDIKPENILVDIDSKEVKTKIIDFGFAAQSSKKLEIFCGTPAYMSPEICGKHKYSG